MRDSERLIQLARAAGAYEQDRLQPVEPPRRESLIFSAADQADARNSLVLQRQGSAYYKDPAKQKRNLFRSDKKKAALTDNTGWTFTKAECFAVVDQHIRQGGQVGFVQAALTANASDPLNVNESYYSDENGNSVASGRPNGWLDLVAERNEVNYVRLLCAAGANQQSKDQALAKSLRKKTLGAAQELFRNNANPNVSAVEYFRLATQEQDDTLIKMFLTSIVPLDQQYINEAMLNTVGRGTPGLLALFFAHGALGEYAEGHALSKAASGQHLDDFATILFYSDDALSSETIENAIVAAASNGSDAVQLQMFELLLWAGANPNSPTLLGQLLMATMNNQRPLAQLLVTHKTSPDHNDAECLRRAITLGHMDIIKLLLQGHISQRSASIAVTEANVLEDVHQYEYVVSSLLEKGVAKDVLHSCLVDAIEKGCDASFIQTLIAAGANIDHADARCIQIALSRHNFSLLRVLLLGQSSPAILCKALPAAMAIQSRSERYDVTSALLDKGVTGRELHLALQTAIGASSKDSDYQLMDLLIRKNASVDYSNEHRNNCISIAVAGENERALDMLVEGKPNPDTISAALSLLPTPFEKADETSYEKTIRMLQTLLEHGAYGFPAASLLVKAVSSDYRGKALDLLLAHSADANHERGKAIEEALKLNTIGPLEKICRHAKIERETFAIQVLNALDPKAFSLQKATLLCQTASQQGYHDVLDQPLLNETRFEVSRGEVIAMLLQLGASVDFMNGEALQHAVSRGDVQTSRSLLSARPSTNTVARAFPRTMQIKDLPTRYALMQSLLNSGGPGMGNEALVQAAREADANDLSHVELLLQHKASPDFKNGMPLLEAVKANNLPLIDLLLKSKPNEITLANAFNLTRQLDCPRDVRHQIFIRLLATEFQGFETSACLIEVVERMPNDIETSVLLLKSGASVDAQKGKSMQLTAAAGSLQLLKIFLLQKPEQQSRDAALRAAALSELDISLRRELYLTLLESGISKDTISTTLFDATHRGVIDDSLFMLLVEYGASLDAHNGAALDSVTTIGNPSLLATMLKGKITHHNTLDRSFARCMQLKDAVSRQEMAQQLLEKEPGVSTKTVSHHLAHVVREKDERLLDLMASYGPDASYNDGESLIIASQEGNEVLTAILTRKELPAQTRDKAFEAMLEKRTIRSTPGGMVTASILLKLGVTQKLLDRALLDTFDDPIDQHTHEVVELLTPYNPNFSGGDGKVFVAASSAKELELFRYMAYQTPDLNIVIPALIVSFAAIPEVQTVDAEGPRSEGPNGTKHEQHAETRPVINSVDGANGDHSANGFDDVNAPSNTGDYQQPDKMQGETAHEQMTNEMRYSKLPNEHFMDHETMPDRDAMMDHEEMLDGDYMDGAEVVENGEDQPQASPTTEQRLVGYLLNLDDCSGGKDIVLKDSVLFTAMKSFPNGILLIDHLLDHGCPASSKIEAMLDPSGKTLRHWHAEPEQMTAVMWALTCEEPTVDEAVVMEILRRGQEAGIDFKTPTTRETATILASAANRSTVLRRLIELGGDPSYRDSQDHSASFYASRNGHLEVLSILHEAGAKVNDGSLQEAAREGHFENVEFLLTSGHRIDFPSALHADGNSGRTPLEEICLKSVPEEDLEVWNDRIYKCIKQLLPATANAVPKSDGKTMMHLALENKKPVPVTRAILEFSSVWENINHPIYLFRDDDGYHYSLTKYIELQCPDIKKKTKKELISLLRDRKCADKFYAHTVVQPAGAVGLPDEIAKAVEKEERAQFDHRENMKRQEELLARRRALDAEDHERRTTNDRNRHTTLTKQQREREETEQAATQRKHAADHAHAVKIQKQRATAAAEESQIRVRGLEEEASRRYRMQQDQQAAELSHQRSLQQQEISALRSKLDLEKQMSATRYQAALDEANVMDGVLERRKATARYEREQRQKASQYD